MPDALEPIVWGRPGSFLLPHALRRLLDDRPVPSDVAGFISAMPPAQPLRTARLPDGWVLLPAVARRLVEFIRIEGLLDVSIVPPHPDRNPAAVDGNDRAELEGALRRSPVLSRLLVTTPGDDITAGLHRATVRDLLRAARNDAEAFLVAATNLDALVTPIAHTNPVAATDGSAASVPPPASSPVPDAEAAHPAAHPSGFGERPLTPDGSVEGRPPSTQTEHHTTSASGHRPAEVSRLLTADVGTAVRILPEERWRALWELLPLRRPTREAILSACAGNPLAARGFLADITATEAAHLPQFGPSTQEAVLLAIRQAVADPPVENNNTPGDPDRDVALLDTAQRAALTGLAPAAWAEILSGLPLRTRNLLLRHSGSPEEVRRFLAAADEDDLAAVPRLESRIRTQLRFLLAGALTNAVQSAPRQQELPTGPTPGESAAPPEQVDPPQIPEGADLINGHDPRFHDLLRPDADLAATLADLPPTQAHQLAARVRDRLARLTATSVEQEGTVLVAAAAGLGADHPRVAAMKARYGLSGALPSTMDDIARVLGVSRARVGQISQKIARNLPTAPVWAPMTDQMVQVVQGMTPCSMADLNEALQGAELTALTWTASALVATATLTGRTLDLHDHDGFAVISDELPAIRAVHSAARRISDRNGAAAVDQVVADVDDPTVTTGLVREFLANRPDVTWLTRDWFSTAHGSGRNRLVNTSLRILVVHQPQTLTRMIDGVARTYTWRNSTGRAAGAAELTVPPVDVVKAFYTHSPAFALDAAGRINLAHPVDPEILGPEKLTLVGVLREQQWPAMTRNDLIDACVAEGMQAGTAQVFLTYAECIENLGPNVWGIRGADVPATVITGLQKSAHIRNRNFDRGRQEGATEGGRPWVSQRITPNLLHSGVLAFRWSVNLDDGSQLTLIDGTDGEPTGYLRRSGHFTYGLNKLLRKNRPVVGDFLRITLYKQDGYAVAEIGGEELGEPPDDWS